MMIADIEDIRIALNMENAAGEILGYFTGERYDNKLAKATAKTFNNRLKSNNDKFAPVMLPLSEMNDMGFLVAYSESVQTFIVMIFIIAMAIVLWNAGLIGGLRRYGEFGLRLAIGENKHEIYRSLIAESFLVGTAGSIIGVILGLLISWYFQAVGIDFGDSLKDSTFLMPSVMRAHINLTTYYIGFVPGIISTVIGSMLAGIGIYKRQTANLFKELEG
jgi:putative ABC transport system permease protein